MNPQIFREYDIRGIASRDLTDPVVETLGKAMGTYMQERRCQTISLARDVRLSSQRLRDALAAGLTATGLKVIDLGVCPTPVLYYSLYHLDVQGGVMITGSHNPPEYNGFKVCVGKATLFGQEIQELGRLAQSGEFRSGQGKVQERSILEDYCRSLVGAFGVLSRPPRVVVDCGNGTASLAAVRIYRDLGCQVRSLYCEPDGRFPNHHPDPTVPEYLQDLIRAVQEEKADLGIAFDGDSDRIGVINDRGEIVWGDELMVLYSRSILREHPGATIIADVKCSQKLFDDIRQKGGRAIMWKTGHSLIKAKLKEEKGALAGEMSGHMFFADRYLGFDDAIYAGARVLEICSKTGEKISQLLEDLPRTWSTPEIRVDCPEELKFEVVRQAREYFSARYPTVTLDGVRVIFEDGWGLVRASNTQPVLVLRFEASTPERLREIRELVEGVLGEIRSKVAAQA